MMQSTIIHRETLEISTKSHHSSTKPQKEEARIQYQIQGFSEARRAISRTLNTKPQLKNTGSERKKKKKKEEPWERSLLTVSFGSMLHSLSMAQISCSGQLTISFKLCTIFLDVAGIESRPFAFVLLMLSSSCSFSTRILEIDERNPRRDLLQICCCSGSSSSPPVFLLLRGTVG